MSGKKINIEKHISFINLEIILSFLPFLMAVLPIWQKNDGSFAFVWDYVKEAIDLRMLGIVLPFLIFAVAIVIGMFRFSKATKEDKNDDELLLKDFKIGTLLISFSYLFMGLVVSISKQFIPMGISFFFAALFVVLFLVFKKRFGNLF